MTGICVMVVGVRPQYIKAAALNYELDRWEQRHGQSVHRMVIDTGQHYSPEMSSLLQAELSLRPVARMVHDCPREASAVLGSTLVKLAALARDWPPSATVVVFGDANPALAGALTARMAGRRLVHVEAGERRGLDEQEDFNTRAVDLTADLALCVTWQAVTNLASEGFRGELVRTGDLAYRWFSAMASGNEAEARRGILVTMHRPQHMKADLLRHVAESLCYRGMPVRWVSHPRSAMLLQTALTGLPVSILPAQGYRAFVRELHESAFVVSDSGGVVREAHLLDIPTVVIRDSGAWSALDEGSHIFRVGSNLHGLAAAADRATAAERISRTFSPLVDVDAIDAGIDRLVTLCQ